MVDVGHFALVCAWLISLYGLIVGSYAAWKGHIALMQSTRNSVIVAATLTFVSLSWLAMLFLRHDYRYAYVWRTSNNEMHPMYLVSAIWGGMDGSMLLWAGILALFAAIAVLRSDGVPRDIMAWVVPVLSGAVNFFLTIVVFLTNPFRLIPIDSIPVDGNGLNPLLQNPSMMIHPPMLYAGFTGLAVPFAFCMAALLSGNLTTAWIQFTRRWTLIAWGCLTLGIILGGHWAYIELGWGGFWAWDPVENASFLPWLTATAFLHSVMVQKRRGSLKVWNISLCALSYILTVFGTFLTRSGVVQSVHAFAETDVGWVFLLYIALLFILTTVLIAYRWNELKPESKIESFFSREAAFLFNNLILLSICFTTFWGVMFPIISEAVAGEKAVVGPPFFNQVNTPLFLSLIFLMGVGPLIAWRRSSKAALVKNFAMPLCMGSIVTVACLFLDPERLGAAISFGLCVFVLITIMAEFHRGAKVRRQLTNEGHAESVLNLVKRKRQQYGGHIVHLGVVVMVFSITTSMVYKTEKDISMHVGEQLTVGRFALQLASLNEQEYANYSALRATVKVSRASDGKVLGYLNPEQRFYQKNDEMTTEVALRATPQEDLYLALVGLDKMPGRMEALNLNNAEAAFKIFINPFQMWLWVGSAIVMLGTLIVIGPRITSLAPAHIEQESKVGVKV
jgi:cytochrome c-type biogenesis protein CcmF